MSVPTLRAAGGHYRLSWSDERLLAEVGRIREDSHFNVTAEVCIRSMAPGTPSHLHQARLNLSPVEPYQHLSPAHPRKSPG
jgi:hypothetical protein